MELDERRTAMRGSVGEILLRVLINWRFYYKKITSKKSKKRFFSKNFLLSYVHILCMWFGVEHKM